MAAKTVPVSDVVVRSRHRKELGDIDLLAESIDRIGLLHPIVVLPDNTLVVGARRLSAYRKLGRDSIPANVAANLDDAYKLILAERDENTCRKNFLPTEGVALADSIAAIAEKEAKRRQDEGRKKGGGDRRSDGAKRSGGNSPKAVRDESARTNAVAAAAIGVDRRTMEKAREVVRAAEKEPEKFAALAKEMDRTGKVNGAFKKLKVAKQTEAIAAEPPPLPKGPFRVIAVDPPWQYDARGNDPTHRAANPYPSMSIADIKALDVGSLATKDAVLWLWTTNAHLPEVFGIVEAWGFTYKTMLTWVKDKMGTGDWLRGKTEHCLLCVKGKPTINLTNQTTALLAKAGKHSAKPDEFYSLVEKLCPGSKLEMFQRSPREGWIGHGDESGTR